MTKLMTKINETMKRNPGLTIESRVMNTKFVAFVYQVNSFEGYDRGRGEAASLEEALEIAFADYFTPEGIAERAMRDIPAAACPRCGGWTSFGGMSQYAKETEPVHGRPGCSCKESK